MTFQKTFLKSAKSNEKKKPKTAQIIIINPLKKDIFVNSINLVCDIYYSLYGKCEIKINGNPEFSPETVAFKLRKEITIPLEDQVLQQGRSIEISIWNPNNQNTDIVELSAQVIISENPGNLTLSGQALDDNTILNGISGGAGNESDTHDIFPYEIYRDETKEFLINTKGRQNMLLTMASSNVLPPEIIPNSFEPTPKPDPLELQIKHSADDTEPVTGEVVESLADCGTFRNPRTGIKTEYKRYTVTEYLEELENVTLDDVLLDDAVFGSFVDGYILVDCINQKDKQMRFQFNSSLFSQDVQSRVMGFRRTKTTTYESVREVQCIPRYLYVEKKILTDWSDYIESSVSYTHTSVIVTLRVSISFVVDVSDDIDFTSYRMVGEIAANKEYTFDFSERYMRIKRVIIGIRAFADFGEEEAESEHTTLEYPDVQGIYAVANLIDLQSHGGTAKVYFALQGVNNQWFVILDSSQLGAVTQGDYKLIRFNIEGIPPSQSRFKAVLQVTGSLKTGVTIDLVA